MEVARWRRRRQPIRQRTGGSATTTATAGSGEGAEGYVESPVLVLERRGCCLIHVVKRLLQRLGVNPVVQEVTPWLDPVVDMRVAA
ncbi:Os10g0177501 [Oryza sativa Japonica Group]|uniref:Os10g0177501 protein n=1 Tax=Oryza sativa subsp. japonica TaxID=39947 RepID=A0A0P0XSI6_ORYSJ|nr:Os10g0177501 [Oryza sativa Japonica Group]